MALPTAALSRLGRRPGTSQWFRQKRRLSHGVRIDVEHPFFLEECFVLGKLLNSSIELNHDVAPLQQHVDALLVRFAVAKHDKAQEPLLLRVDEDFRLIALLVDQNAGGTPVYEPFEPRQEIRDGVVNIAGRDFHRCAIGADDDRPPSGVRCAALNGEAFRSARYAGRLAHHLTWCAPALRFLVVGPAPRTYVPGHRPVDFRRSVLVSHPTQSGADLSYFGDVITVPANSGFDVGQRERRLVDNPAVLALEPDSEQGQTEPPVITLCHRHHLACPGSS
jgi:hypothetical protein